jgi:hypothetical protein
MPRFTHCFAALALCALSPITASARQTAEVSARFTPEHLAAPTTISLGFKVEGDSGAAPPLREIELAYPRTLGIATSGLGVAACAPEALEVSGPGACPANSRMGKGTALVEITIGPEIVREQISLAIFAAPSSDGYLHVLVYASGRSPVIAQVLLSGVLLAGRVDMVLPPIPSLPEAPYVAVARMQLTLGGDLTYYERRGSRTIAYRPRGVGLPGRCPRGGFRFAARFAFIDGEHANAQTSVTCPRPGAHRTG